MPAAPRLEVFNILAAPADGAEFLDATAVEEFRKSAYEAGYAAGWQDAQTERDSAEALRRESAEDALRSLHFTHEEARAHVLGALLPLLRAMAETVLPELAQATLGASVAEQVRDIARASVVAPITLHCNAAAAAVLAPRLRVVEGFDLRMIEEPSLTDGQLILRADPAATEIDIDAAVAAARAAIAEFAAQSIETCTLERKIHG